MPLAGRLTPLDPLQPRGLQKSPGRVESRSKFTVPYPHYLTRSMALGGKEIKSLQLFGLSLGCSGLLAGVVYGLQIEHSGSPGSCPDFPPPSPYGSLGADCTPL